MVSGKFNLRKIAPGLTPRRFPEENFPREKLPPRQLPPG